jgi:hypothetical protein
MRLLLQSVVFTAVALAGVNPGLMQVHAVYILPMASGMDQFLANRISRAGMMQVVADPQAADAILTDHLGETFEKKLVELYPPVVKEDDEDTDEKADKTKDDSPAQLRPSSFGRGKGTWFIVDRKSRSVLWSIYELPKNSRPDELNKIGERVVNHLKRDLKPASQVSN